MNRIIPVLFEKSFFTLFGLLLCSNAFATTFEASESGIFSSASTWGGNSPTMLDGDFFYIEDNKTVTIDVASNLIMGKLTINSGSVLKIIATGNVTITILDLIINENGGDPSGIDFGTGNVTIIIKNNLLGAAFSKIIHNPGSGKLQQLILKGEKNNLYTYTSGGAGISTVTYERFGDQNVFNSDNYMNLELLGAGTKKLNGPSSPGAEATVKNKLVIEKCKLESGDRNFNYLGTEINLSCTDGWIYTGTGFYKSNLGNIRTFPVGDATSPKIIFLTNINATEVRVHFISNTSIPYNGLGIWEVSSSNNKSVNITFTDPSSSKISSASQIAFDDGSSGWKIQPTTYTSNSYSSTNTIPINSLTKFSLFTCPQLTTSPSSLPDAELGVDYTKSLILNGGTGPYTVSTPSFNPSGIYSSATSATALTITGKPKSLTPVTLSFTFKDVYGCKSSSLNYIIDAISLTTTWNGTSWSYGAPTPIMEAIIAGNYSTATNNITAKSMRVNAGAVLTITATGTVIVGGSLNNQGTINKACAGTLTYTAPLTGNPIVTPTILPAQLPTGIEGQAYSQQFSVSDNSSATNFSMSGAPAWLGLNGTMLIGAAEDVVPGTYSITVTNAAAGCTISKNYILKMDELSSPNLTILTIPTKTFGDKNFNINSYSRSSGEIMYSKVSGSCVSVTSTGVVSITCAGQVTVQATQAPRGIYKGETVTKSFTIIPATGKLQVLNYAFLNGVTTSMNVYSPLPAPVYSYDQLTGFDNAMVHVLTGSVSTYKTGSFSVRISLAATANYTAFDSVYVFNVVAAQKPPVAVSDTIVIEMGMDSTFNILENDLGMTTEIAPNKTDVDIENNGIQTKFYATELGNFLIDAEGNLTIKPFYGFIGNGRLAYTIADVTGLRSEIAYVEVVVQPPYVVPELKVNNVMTPNGDNLNDALVIANTDLSKENSMIVMDQIGNTVYETINYQNNWEGTDTKNNKLEPGIYFYVFKEKNGRELKNYIQIIK